MRYELRVGDDAGTELSAGDPTALLRLVEEADLPLAKEVVVELAFGDRTIATVLTIVFELRAWVDGPCALPRPCL